MAPPTNGWLCGKTSIVVEIQYVLMIYIAYDFYKKKEKYKYLNFKIANVGASYICYVRSLPKNKKWNTQYDVNDEKFNDRN